MTRKSRRLALIGAAVATLGLGVGLILFALRDNLEFFYSPAELVEKGVQPGTHLRIGGLVKPGSIVHLPDARIDFTVTDMVKDVHVTFHGIPPDLFKEGQGVLVYGVLQSPGDFVADEDGVIAKHDEKYMPREVAEALKKQGRWQEGGTVGLAAAPQGAQR